MTPGRAIVVLLVSLAVVMDLAMLRHVDSFPAPSALAFLGFILAQTVLLAQWLVCGTSSRLFRWVACLVAVPLLSWLASECTAASAAELQATLWLTAALVVGGLYLLSAGSSNEAERCSRPEISQSRSTRHWRYRMSDWFVLSAVVAVVLLQVQQFPWLHVTQAGSFVLTTSCLALCTIWSAQQGTLNLPRLALVTLVGWGGSSALEVTFGQEVVLLLVVEATALWIGMQVLATAAQSSPTISSNVSALVVGARPGRRM